MDGATDDFALVVGVCVVVDLEKGAIYICDQSLDTWL
jgi:hypothetical protein